MAVTKQAHARVFMQPMHGAPGVLRGAVRGRTVNFADDDDVDAEEDSDDDAAGAGADGLNESELFLHISG